VDVPLGVLCCNAPSKALFLCCDAPFQRSFPKGIPDEALEDDPKWRISDRKAVQPGDRRDLALTHTEQTIRFGLFTLTFM
jgi:hypothetical protein